MEVNRAELIKLQREVENLRAYVGRIHQYHLGARPSFMFRNQWNNINDALHEISIRTDSISEGVNGLLNGDFQVPWNVKNIPRRNSSVREA